MRPPLQRDTSWPTGLRLQPLLAALLASLAPLAGCQQDPAPPAAAAPMALGPWRATLASPGGAITLGMELVPVEGGVRAILVNGEERREAGRIERDGDEVRIPLPPYRSTLVARADPDGRGLTGYWERDRGEGPTPLLPFAAVAGTDARPPAAPDPGAVTAVAGRWRVRFEGDEDDAVGLFDVAPTGRATGTFLTTLGDYRFLSGWFDGEALRLGCFDGAHAFLFEARLDGDGDLSGDFWSRDSFHTTWTASKDPEARLADDFSLTRWTPSASLEGLRFPDADGVPRALAELLPAGRPALLVVFGTWCPNCNDLTELLGQLGEEYPDLSIVGVAFEMGEDPERHRAAVRGYVAHHGVDHPVLIGGPASKAGASAALPILDRVRAYPTTVFLGRDGRPTAVHTGFSGPATGARHQVLVERFRSEIESLLAGE